MANRQKSGQRILIVDDEKNYRIILAQLFTQVGYQVATAASVNECLAFFQHDCADLVLTDVYLAGADGLDLCQEIQLLTGGLPCIVFSACLPATDQRFGAVTGIIEYIAKPFDINELLAKVEQVLLTTV